MKIIGRKRETTELEACLSSSRPEFVVVYGRRRVGKTYLIREYLSNQFSFYSTGVLNQNNKGQLKAFNESLKRYGMKGNIPSDWFEAFSRLRELLSSSDVYRELKYNKRIVFLDEMPWMDSPKSDFKAALDFFWNSWGSAQDDLCLIVCGSATSWIIDNLINDKGGFHNRLTKRILLMPFSLGECEELLNYNGISMSKKQQIESYMIFGGIPYYLNLLDHRYSLAQNVEELCFKNYGELHDEYDNLFRSLFKKPDKHIAIIKALANTKSGLTRNEIVKKVGLTSGSVLTRVLLELEQCGFIRKYKNFSKKTNDQFYQLIDPFTLFCIKNIRENKIGSWLKYINTPGYNSWRGNAFEIVCLNHVGQLKKALGISGVETSIYSWRSDNEDQNVQIDLMIDREDGVINLCEMKYTNDEYELDGEESQKLLKRLDTFAYESKTKKSIHLTLVTAAGFKRGKYSGILQSVITGDDLFYD